MPFRIETDPTLRRACGTDGPAWASAYLANRTAFDGDHQHIELAAWFDAALKAGVDLVLDALGDRRIIHTSDAADVVVAMLGTPPDLDS